MVATADYCLENNCCADHGSVSHSGQATQSSCRWTVVDCCNSFHDVFAAPGVGDYSGSRSQLDWLEIRERSVETAAGCSLEKSYVADQDMAHHCQDFLWRLDLKDNIHSWYHIDAVDHTGLNQVVGEV